MKNLALLFVLSVLILSCSKMKTNENDIPMSPVSELDIKFTLQKVLDKYGVSNKFRIERGVRQCATLWRNSDGTVKEFEDFCLNNFIDSDKDLEIVFQKISTNFETVYGFYNRMSIDLKRPLHLNLGDITPLDELFGSWDPSAHLGDDLYSTKIAFVVALNFPFYSLKEKMEMGPKWTRLQWAYTRVGDLFTSRVPADIIQNVSVALTSADNYISAYNIYVGNLVDDQGKTYFPKDKKLISHWGLRDELKSHYADKENGLFRQKMIYEVMMKIITQEIPDSVINNPGFQWNPFANKLYKEGKEVTFKAEDNVRYATLLKNFKVEKAMDKYTPLYPTYIQRQFEQGMELPQADVEKLFIEFLSSPQVGKVAELISIRLGRQLQPFDIWYDGFKARSAISEDELTKKTIQKYPNPMAFEKDMPNILEKLGFPPDKAAFISSKIVVDAARGSGHAWGSMMKDDKSHLRTRAGKDGMDYKGYNIAIHEFGHNVEQTISIQDVDYYLLGSVPSTAFTEATAFVFQKRDLEILGIKDDYIFKDYLMALDNFWSCYEIMGVSLVDMNVWKWLYAHPDATPDQLKVAVITISKTIWNKYYAPVFGIQDQPVLAIYSHMIDNPLYLSAYPIGHIIEFQVEKQLTGKNFAAEIMRMYTYGKIIPQLWMKNAVGTELSIKPILEAVDESLLNIFK